MLSPRARAIVLAFAMIGVARVIATEVASSPFVPAGYQMIWNDEFDGNQLDTTKWQVRYPGPREAGFVSADAVSLDGHGHLLLTTKEQDGKLLNGHIGTSRAFRHTFGYYEARIKFEQQRGQHGCFWLQSDVKRIAGDPHGSGLEVDIAEFFGPGRKDSGLGVNVYWTDAQNQQKREGGMVNLDPILGASAKKPNRPGLNADFHIFGLLWTPELYVFTIDGHEVSRISAAVSHQPAYIVLSLFTANWEVAFLDRAKLPDSMIVDYVRVYAPKEESAPAAKGPAKP
jgi:beta-glucanase (GH16 family)